jgi:hypothetical protein
MRLSPTALGIRALEDVLAKADTFGTACETAEETEQLGSITAAPEKHLDGAKTTKQGVSSHSSQPDATRSSQYEFQHRANSEMARPLELGNAL